MTNERRTVRVHITGRVQGVGFRAWTRSQSLAFGLAGWVRNEPDGSVSALIHGKADKIEPMLERLRAGPPGAAVSRVEAEEDVQAAPSGTFEVRY